MQCTACQETSHSGLLILVSKDFFFFPWNTCMCFPLFPKHIVEDGTVSNRGTEDPFLLCFLSSSQTLVELQTRNISIFHGYFTAWVLGPALCPDSNPRKPLVWGHMLVTPKTKICRGGGTLVCRARGTHCSLWHSLRVLLDWGDLQDIAFSPT